MEEIIKGKRVELDSLIQLIKDLPSSTEIVLADLSLNLSKMWLGKVLGELGTDNPYPEGKNFNNEKIEPTADVAKNPTDDEWIELSHIQRVKLLRSKMETIELYLKDIYYDIMSGKITGFNNYWLHRQLEESIVEIVESSMWLGMELGRIRNSK